MKQPCCEKRGNGLSKPCPGSVFYPSSGIVDDKTEVYACLAFEPWVEGHTIVHWYNCGHRVEDIGCLSEEEYIKLMLVVRQVRDCLMKVYGVPKVYLVYMDETRDVHWHLVPRKECSPVKGQRLLCQYAGKIENFRKKKIPDKIEQLTRCIECQKHKTSTEAQI